MTRPVDPPPLDSGWTERLPWTAGCFCAGGRPAGMGAVSAVGWGGCIGTVCQHSTEERVRDSSCVTKETLIY